MNNACNMADDTERPVIPLGRNILVDESHPLALTTAVHECLRDNVFSDLLLVCAPLSADGQRNRFSRYSCHRAVLAAASPVLASLLSSTDARVVTKPVVVLHDVQPRALKSLLRFIYTGEIGTMCRT